MKTEQFVKYTFRKSLNTMIKRLQLNNVYINEVYGEPTVLFENIGSVTLLNRNIVKLYEYVYYTTSLKDDIAIISKRIQKEVENYNIDTKEFYTLKFEIYNLLQVASVSEEMSTLSQEEITRVSSLYFIGQIIELIKYRTDKRLITGIDDKGDIRYVSDSNLLLDNMNSKFVTDKEKKYYLKYLPMVVDKLMNSFMNLRFAEASALANDKIDECLNGIRETRLILNMLNIEGKIDIEERLNTLRSSICMKGRKDIWESRNFICEEEIVLNYEYGDIRTIKLRDLKISNKYPCISIQYVTEGNIENSFIIPTNIDCTIHCYHEDLMEKIIDFFEGNSNKNLVDNEFWKFRFDKNKDKIAKNYKTQVVTINMHRAKMGNPSQKAITMANEWNIKLRPGETLVEKHIRKYGMNK